jgi:hypothetical protein
MRLHSAYLYGSIPRGTAIPGISDLDRRAWRKGAAALIPDQRCGLA